MPLEKSKKRTKQKPSLKKKVVTDLEHTATALQPKKKHPGGRPSKYKPEFCDTLIYCAEKCEPFEYASVCCVELGIHGDTLCDWRQKFPEFSEAYKRGISIWRRRLAAYAADTKLDYRYYRSWMWQVAREIVEPAIQNENIHKFESLPELQKLNEE